VLGKLNYEYSVRVFVNTILIVSFISKAWVLLFYLFSKQTKKQNNKTKLPRHNHYLYIEISVYNESVRVTKLCS